MTSPLRFPALARASSSIFIMQLLPAGKSTAISIRFTTSPPKRSTPPNTVSIILCNLPTAIKSDNFLAILFARMEEIRKQFNSISPFSFFLSIIYIYVSYICIDRYLHVNSIIIYSILASSFATIIEYCASLLILLLLNYLLVSFFERLLRFSFSTTTMNF
jgi:hypothetical protein